MGISEKLVAEIVGRILGVAKAKRIILFGSALTGGMTKDSDIDVLIVEDDVVDQRGESTRIDVALSGMGHPFDVIVMSTGWFEASKAAVGGIAYLANKYGRVIYDAAEG